MYSSQNSINIYFANFRSIGNKIIDLKIKTEELKLDIIIGNETWLKSTLTNNQILNGFHIPFCLVFHCMHLCEDL